MNEEKKLVPRLRFPEFREAGEWKSTVLGELSQVVRGGSPRPIDDFLTTAANGLNWLKIGDVDKEAKYVTQTAEKVRPDALSKTRVVNPGDLILSNSMSFGRPYILEIETCIHDGWIAVTYIADEVTRDFLYYLISEPNSQSYFLNNAAGSGVQNLNADIIKALPVCHPSSSEQQKIADCLSSLDELIAALARKVDALKTHKKGLMQQLFPREGETQPRLRFPEFRDAEEWEVNKLGRICKSIASGKDKNDLEGTFDLYGSTGVIGKTSEATFDGTYILVARVGANAGFLNKVTGKFGVTDNTLIVDLHTTDQLDFVYCCLDKIGLNKFVFGSGQPLITGTQLKELRVSFPFYKEQQRIADCLTSLDNLITAATQELETLKTHKKALMQQLFPSAEAVEK